MSIPLPNIDPVIVYIGPLAIRWYSLAYIIGILVGFLGVKKNSHHIGTISNKALDDILSYSTIGIIIGARLGNVFFYDPQAYWHDPIAILKIWEGGMSFHGGFIGVIFALFFACKKNNLPFLKITDLTACFAPIGIFLGRAANFINGELWGKVTNVPWGMVFPHAGPLPRHPSQIYEAITEGLLLFLFMMLLLFKSRAKDYPGMMTGVMIIWYACARILIEFFREPYVYSIYFDLGITVGQILSVIMLIIGVIIVITSPHLKNK